MWECRRSQVKYFLLLNVKPYYHQPMAMNIEHLFVGAGESTAEVRVGTTVCQRSTKAGILVASVTDVR